jgi:hypothetical protein
MRVEPAVWGPVPAGPFRRVLIQQGVWPIRLWSAAAAGRAAGTPFPLPEAA